MLGESDKLSNVYSIKDELQADSLAMQLMIKSRYNIKAVMNAFELLGRMENNMSFRSIGDMKLKETDHPPAGNRYTALESFYKKYRNDLAPYYVVSSETFKELKKKAAPEILECLMQQHDYATCTDIELPNVRTIKAVS